MAECGHNPSTIFLQVNLTHAKRPMKTRFDHDIFPPLFHWMGVAREDFFSIEVNGKDDHVNRKGHISKS